MSSRLVIILVISMIVSAIIINRVVDIAHESYDNKIALKAQSIHWKLYQQRRFIDKLAEAERRHKAELERLAWQNQQNTQDFVEAARRAGFYEGFYGYCALRVRVLSLCMSYTQYAYELKLGIMKPPGWNWYQVRGEMVQ